MAATPHVTPRGMNPTSATGTARPAALEFPSVSAQRDYQTRISETDAHTYTEGVRRGGTLVTVRAGEGHATTVMNILEEHGSIDIGERSQSWRSDGWSGPALTGTEASATMPGDEVSTRAGGRPGVRTYPTRPV